MNHRRRLISSAAFAAVTALVFFLPHLLSTPGVFSFLVTQLSHRLPGDLQIASCSLRWSGGLACTGVRYVDVRQGIGVELPQIRTDKGLFTLLVAPQYLGEITLKEPRLEFLQPAVPNGSPHKDDASGAELSGQQLPISWWEERSLRLHLHNGQILVHRGGESPSQVLARELSLSGDLASGTANYVLDFQSDQTGGQFHAQGFVNLPVAGQPFFPSLISQSTLDVRSLEIGPMLALASSRFPKMPQGHGMLTGACTLNMAGVDNLDIKGLVGFNDLHLIGGVLGKDRPELKQARLIFEGSRHPVEGWRLSQLELHSDPLSFTGQGLLDQQRIDFTGQGAADLAQLTQALPQFFAIHQQTLIQQGQLNFSFQATGTPDRIRLQTDCETKRLELIQADRPYAFDNPLALHVAATVHSSGVRFDRLQLQAPFLTVEGQGGAEDFSLQATAELEHLFAELDKIFALQFHALGRLDLALESARLDTERIRLTTRLAIDGFGVEFEGRTLLPKHPFSLTAALIGQPWFVPGAGLQAMRVDADGWPGELHIDADQLNNEPRDSGKGSGENSRIQTVLDLARLEQIFRAIHGQAGDVHLQGRLQAETRGVWQQQHMRLHHLVAQLNNVVLTAGNAVMLRESKVQLGAEQGPLNLGPLNLGALQVVESKRSEVSIPSSFCRIDLDPFFLDLHHLRLRAPDKIVDLRGFIGKSLGKREQPQLEVRALVDLHQLTPWFKQQGWLADTFDMAGRTKAILTVSPKSEKNEPQTTDLSIQVTDLSLHEGKTLYATDPKLSLELQLQAAGREQQAIKIARLAVQSSLFSYSGAGLAHTRQTPPLLDLKGQLQPSVAAVVKLIKPLVPGEVSLATVKSGDVLISTPLFLPVNMEQVTLSGQQTLENLRYMGVSLPAATVAIDLNRSTLGMQITGSSSGGLVNLQPRWQHEGGHLLLRLPPESQVLRSLPLSRDVSRELMRQLPPFGALVDITGTVGLKMHRFFLPLTDKKRRPDFAAVIDLEKARPQPVLAFKKLLETAGLSTQSVRFQERELVCEGWNGSITCAPLRLAIGEQAISISGSRRRNGRIAYKVELPLTPSLTRQAGVAVYGPFTAVAEISGTQQVPVFDQAQFFTGLAAQITATLPQPLAKSSDQAGSPTKSAEPAADE